MKLGCFERAILKAQVADIADWGVEFCSKLALNQRLAFWSGIILLGIKETPTC